MVFWQGEMIQRVFKTFGFAYLVSLTVTYAIEEIFYKFGINFMLQFVQITSLILAIAIQKIKENLEKM